MMKPTILPLLAVATLALSGCAPSVSLGDHRATSTTGAGNSSGPEAGAPERSSLVHRRVSTSGLSTCAVTQPGRVKCWGDDQAGALGTASKGSSLVPVDVAGLGDDMMEVSVGELSACALSSSGEARCWGDNLWGELGSSLPHATFVAPTRVDIPAASSLSAGAEHVCSLGSGGEVWCWGRNDVGQMGNGASSDNATPQPVMGLGAEVVRLSAGYLHACVVTSVGSVMCWGGNDQGQVGPVGTSSRSTPFVAVPSGIVEVAAAYDHTCVLSEDGGVSCWGGLVSALPVPVAGLSSGVRMIAGGARHTCALLDEGGVRCWGWNPLGGLGDGHTFESDVPVDVVGLPPDVVSITAGGETSCAMTEGGRVFCWGNNQSGQLGDGTVVSRAAPIEVMGL